MLVREKLAACVQILPEMESVYRWQGQIERQNETMLIAKSKQSEFAALEKEVRRIHSYETPEIVACQITAGSEPYLKWLDESFNSERF
jgi:periplasmic divalent cation tolerance protein